MPPRPPLKSPMKSAAPKCSTHKLVGSAGTVGESK